jgi:Domain of unknown function (DUF4157)
MMERTVPTPKAPLIPAPGRWLQRKCACGGTPGPTGECEACRRKRLALRSSSRGQAEHSATTPLVHEVLRSPGQALDPGSRAFFEPRFGHNFSHVRVHTDARAAESARAVNALAYTVGHDIVFGSSMYRPATLSGLRLLAHELAHVMQQKGVPSSHLQISPDENPLERQADSVAEMVLSQQKLPPIIVTKAVVQRRGSSVGPQAGPSTAPSGGGALCAAHPHEAYYKGNPSYCMDTSHTGALHTSKGFRCYREIPTGSGCPPGKHICFKGGRCDPSESHIDSTAPCIKRLPGGSCDVPYLCGCSVIHFFRDVIPALYTEGMEQQAKCVENCQKLPSYAQGFCVQGCTGVGPY